MLIDLDELILKCRSESSKEHITDAVSCYKAGAFKPCISATWMAVVYDIIDKAKELSLTGDKKAKDVLDKFNEYREQIESGNEQGIALALGFERNILSVAKNELDIIDEIQFNELSRLKDDRNRCSHPSFRNDDLPYNPSPELARYHMRNAVDYILNAPPLQGRSALNLLLKTIKSQYFPVDEDSIYKEIKNSPFGNSTDHLKESLIDELFFDFFEKTRFPNKTYANLLRILNACHKINSNIVRERFLRQINKYYVRVEDDKFFILVCMIVKFNENIWDGLDSALQTRIKNFLTTGNKLSISYAFPDITKVNELSSETTRFINSLNIKEIKDIFSNNSNDQTKSILFNKVVDLYIDSRTDWNVTNSIAWGLLIPNAYNLTEKNINDILLMIKEYPENIKDSHSFSQVISTLYEYSKLTPIQKDFIDGILTEIGKSDIIVSQSDYDKMTPIPF